MWLLYTMTVLVLYFFHHFLKTESKFHGVLGFWGFGVLGGLGAEMRVKM